MKAFLFTVKQKMVGFTLPTILLSIFALTLFANHQATSILSKEHQKQMDYSQSNAIVAIQQIDASFDMLDKHLEIEMAEAVLEFKRTYEALYKKNGGEVDLNQIKKSMKDKYDLIVINSELTIFDTTMPEALNFNFSDFDKELGQRMLTILNGNQVTHEKIRTNVSTGLLTKFSYVSGLSNRVIFEISFSDSGFAEAVQKLDPIKTLERIASTNPIVESIRVFDVYGYQFTNSGDKYKPTDESTQMVKRAIEEKSYVLQNGVITKRIMYLPESSENPLSDHSRIIEITYDATPYETVVNNLSLLVFAVGMVLVLFIMIILYIGIGKITKPISELSEMALKVANGDYEVVMLNDMEEADEIGRLKHTFNLMVRRVKSAYYEIENKLKTTLLSMGDGLIATNSDNQVEVMNGMAEKLTGWTLQEAYGMRLDEVIRSVNFDLNEDEFSQYYEEKSIRYEVIQSQSGEEVPIEKTTSPIIDKQGHIQGYVIVFRDVTDQRDKMNRIEYLSYHDQLTGAFNRRYFEVAMKALSRETNLPLSLVMIDVNGLKLVNDAFGHTIGDDLLKQAAEFMQTECRRGDVFARIGGDEFVLLLPNTDELEAEHIMARIQKRSKTILVNKLIFSVSYGVGTLENANTSMNDVFKIAEDNMYRKKLSESTSMRYQMIELILKTLYEKNEREKNHSERVSTICEGFSKYLNLSDDEIKEIKSAGLMHDIGKIAIDLSLLDKPEDLSVAERLEIERHPEVGYQMLKSVNEFSKISEYILAHHEQWDGNGYPRKLKGDDIPLASRIVAMADFYDALSSDRPYRKAMKKEEVIQELERGSGTLFDPKLLEKFINFVSVNKMK